MLNRVPGRLHALAYFMGHLDVPAFFRSGPVLVFNHIPKCGGSSLRLVLRHWYWVVKEYWDGEKMPGIDLNRLRHCHCLCDHYLGKQLTPGALRHGLHLRLARSMFLFYQVILIIFDV